MRTISRSFFQNWRYCPDRNVNGARLRERSRWLDHLDCLLDATSIRKAAGIVGVHRTTSFRWRHRFLTGVQDQPRKHLATRYLPHYLAWRQVIDAKKVRSSDELRKATIEPFHN